MTIAAALLVALLDTDPQQVCVDVKSFAPLTRVACDNGSYLVDEGGNINYRCVRDRCSLFDESCWDFRLSHCYDDGIDNGQCALESETCTTLGGCLLLWAWCEGTLDCAEGGVSSEWCVCTEDG
jgi:hypothetical protein